MVADEVDLIAVTDAVVSVIFVDEIELDELIVKDVVKDGELGVELLSVTDDNVTVMLVMVEEFEVLVVIVVVDKVFS